MKIAILGSGAMGSIYGGYLSANNDVYLIDIWKEHIDEIKNNGLTIEEADGVKVFYPKAVTSAEEVGVVDLVVIFVKSTQTYDSLLAAKCLIGDQTIVLSLQNGYGNHEQMEKIVEKDQIVIGTTGHGATMLKAGNVRHAGWGFTQVGSLGEDNKNVELVAKTLRESGFETTVQENVLAIIWHKLFINAGVNAVTALLGQTNIVVCDCPYAHDITELLVREAVAVANASGFDFDVEHELASVYEAAKKTYNNRSSMLQDVERKRATEITTVNGAIVRAAEKCGIPAPYNTMICKLIQGVQYYYGVK